MSKMTRRREVYTRKKSRGLGRRENFLQLYNRTCHRIYFYSFECCNNRHDAEMIMRDAFIYMFEHIAELRRSSSLDEWQHQCVEKAFRALLRSQLLMLTEDDTTYTPSSQLSESEKEEIWNRIIKMADIDPWRMVPIPGKSTIFSVLADQTISDLRYMTIGDIVKSVLMIIAMLAVAAAAIYFAVDYIKSRQDIAVDETQEIFLDERYYEQFDASAQSQTVDPKLVNDLLSSALGRDVDEEGNRLPHNTPDSIGNTAGTPEYTNDTEINSKLMNITKEVIKGDMSDFQKLEALYEYVGSHTQYKDYATDSEDEVSILRDYFEHNGGTSLHYATALSALCRAAGYRSKVIEGKFVLNRDTEFERGVKHYWTMVSLNGIVYYLDLEAVCNEDGTEVRKYYFMAADGNHKWEIFDRDHVAQ